MKIKTRSAYNPKTRCASPPGPRPPFTQGPLNQTGTLLGPKFDVTATARFQHESNSVSSACGKALVASPGQIHFLSNPYMAKNRSFGGLIILGLIIAAVAAGYFYWTKGSEKPPEISTVTIARGELVQTVTATGGLEAVLNVNVSSQISGIIQKLYVDWNSPVKKDQVLAELDPSTYKASALQAEGQLANAKANYNLVKANTERTRKLFQQNLVTQSDLDTAEAQLQQAEAQIKIQTAMLENAQVNLARCTIYSPIDGTVISRQVDVGNTVAASLSAPTLFIIVNDLTHMQINADVSEADIGNVDLGQTVYFTVDAFPGRQFRGRVSQIRNSPKTSQNVVVYSTIIDVSNDDLKLKPGMTANVSVVVARRDVALKVSNGALRVRVPDSIKVLAADGATPAAAPVAKPLSDDERRKAIWGIMQEVGFQRGSGPMSPEMKQKAEELAKARGIEIDFSRFGGGSNRSSAPAGVPVTRTVYKLVGTDPKAPQLQAVSVKLGITDGIATEAIDGLKEGDVIVTGISVANKGTASAPASNPFGGGQRRF